jgi:hypothetical protein
MSKINNLQVGQWDSKLPQKCLYWANVPFQLPE